MGGSEGCGRGDGDVERRNGVREGGCRAGAAAAPGGSFVGSWVVGCGLTTCAVYWLKLAKYYLHRPKIDTGVGGFFLHQRISIPVLITLIYIRPVSSVRAV